MAYLNGALSTPRNIKHRVAQGSLLRHLIFSFLVNDLPQCISGQVVQYADDTTLLCRGSNDQQLEERGDAMLSEANAWFGSNKLLLNEEKTTELVFTSKRNKTPKSAESAKLLETILDTRLTWRDEIDAFSKKSSSVLYAIRRNRSIMNKETAIVAYHALFHSRMTYSIELWGESAHAN
ncbi:Reverse transcriptase (RNA-dependent DNA polymerase), partial [Popillia japonica]